MCRKARFAFCLFLLCAVVITKSFARISRETTTEAEPFESSGESGASSDALKSYLKELDKYVAIAGRPRFGKRAPTKPESHSSQWPAAHPPPAVWWPYLRRMNTVIQ